MLGTDLQPEILGPWFPVCQWRNRPPSLIHNFYIIAVTVVYR